MPNAPVSVVPTDQEIPVLRVERWDPPTATVHVIISRYIVHGVVVVEGPDPDRAGLAALAAALHLGHPFTPPIYRDSDHTGVDGVSALTAAPAGTVAHPFQDRGGQKLHCDGTLQTLGQIPTTLMICVRPATIGGATILFDAPAAFEALQATDDQAAAQLVHPGALVRTSTIVEGQSTAGPAFGWQEGRVITRYSLTDTDTFHPRDPGEQPALDRALKFLRNAAQPGSPYRREFTLRARQALVLANDRLCHGRSAYQDDPAAPRLMLRALFTRRPSVARLDDQR